jgi:hypothetical protein
MIFWSPCAFIWLENIEKRLLQIDKIKDEVALLIWFLVVVDHSVFTSCQHEINLTSFMLRSPVLLFLAFLICLLFKKKAFFKAR